MTSTPSRIGLWSALSLAVPAVLAAAWAFLEPGGLVARAVENERRTAERAVNAATETFTMSMRQRARETPIALELDAARTVVGPFAPAAAAETAAEPSLAERTAIARFAAGDRDGAIEFFAHAKKAGELSRLGLLQYGNALASADARAALALLGEAEAGFANARCGPLPFAALRLAAEVRWSHAANAPLRDGHRDAALAALRITPSSHVEAVVAELGLDEPTTRAVVAAAKAASALRARRSEAPSSAHRDPNLGLLVPIDELRLAVLDEHAIESLRAQAFAAAHAAEPDLELVLGDASSSTATAHVTGLDEIWTARATSMRTSAVLRVAARVSLVLSLVTLVLGNLLVWRTNRREAQLVALRSDFVDVVSHELRTPLAAMSLKSEMLANGDVPEERRAHYLQAMHQDV
ncbi:MAG: histidine kinase dimerization/phospho-acceptor domain-containing protein, partial [Planctomycetota bacterium]